MYLRYALVVDMYCHQEGMREVCIVYTFGKRLCGWQRVANLSVHAKEAIWQPSGFACKSLWSHAGAILLFTFVISDVAMQHVWVASLLTSIPLPIGFASLQRMPDGSQLPFHCISGAFPVAGALARLLVCTTSGCSARAAAWQVQTPATSTALLHTQCS